MIMLLILHLRQKMIFFGLLLLCFSTLSSSVSQPKFYDLDNAEDLFENFIRDYDKNYMNDEDKLMRFDIFKKNLHDINEKNKDLEEPVFGITKFIDLLEEEFQSYQGCTSGEMPKECKHVVDPKLSIGAAPESFDWRDKNVITRIKNQGLCGSCWAFSAIGNVESQYAIKHGKMVELSEQQLADCAGPLGCCGLYTINAVLHMKKYGVMLEADYSYKGCNSKCLYKEELVKVNVTDCLDFSSVDEEQLKEVLYEYGPISIAVCINGWRTYKQGVLKHCNCEKHTHAVLLVGYGTERGIPYWTIKNSWGTNYGMEGYIKIKRGINSCNMMSPRGYRISTKVA